MAKKFRIKLKNSRVIGPFELAEVKELFKRGHVCKNCEFQEFPLGDWIKIELDPYMSSLLDKVLEKSNTSEIEEETEFREFNYSHSADSQNSVNYNEISQNYKDAKKKEEEVDQILEKNQPSGKIEKTVIRRSNISPPVENVDKTVLISRTDLPELHESQEVVEEKVEDTKDEIVEEKEDFEEIDINAKTQIIDLKELLPEIKKDYIKSKNAFEKSIEADTKDLIVEEDAPEEETVITKLIQKKKKMKPVVALAFIVILWVVLFPDESEKKAPPPIWAKISFPIVKSELDEEQAALHRNNGIKLLKKNTYISTYKAHIQFRKSLEHQFSGNEAAGLFVLSAAEIFDNIKLKDKAAASQAVYKLIRISQSKRLKDVNLVTGSSLFYYKMKYYETAKILASNYLRVGKPSKKLYAIYLMILLKTGDFVNSKKVYEKLSKVKKLPFIAYLALNEYLKQNEEFEKAMKLIKDAGKIYSNNIPILLEYANLLEITQDMKKMTEVLKLTEKLNFERSPIYLSRFFEKMGVLSAYLNKNKEAVNFFKLAFKINESNELRSKLAALELGGSKNTEALILESKIIELMNKAKKAVKEFNWELAFNFAIEACDLDDMYIPSHLLLAEIQVKRGYFNSALKTLEDLKNFYPRNADLNYALIESYINAYRLSDAQREIAVLRKTKLELKPKTASVVAQYYRKTGNIILTLKWLAKSVNRDPLNADEYYLTAITYFEYRKYKKVKYNIARALELDPLNSKYITLNARLLFELDGADTAIGFLRKHLERDKENPRILGEIAIYYYKSNQIKEFERYRDRIKKQNLKDEAFYEFLIRAAKLEGKDDDVMTYARELIKINPGDLESRMILGEYLYSRQKFTSAIEIFNSVKLRLMTYPRTSYYLAKSYLQLGQVDNAERAAKDEIKHNTELESGYYILGEVLRKKQDYLGAKKNFNKAISINDKYVEALLGLGWIKMRRNYNAAAKELYLRAMREEPNNPLIHRQLGKIYMNISQNILAIESFKAYLTLMPNAHDRYEIEQYLKRLK